MQYWSSEDKNIMELGPYPGTGMYYFGYDNAMVLMGKSSRAFTEKR
jgi:hypothetical protein